MTALKILAIWVVAAVVFCALWTAAHGGWRDDK